MKRNKWDDTYTRRARDEKWLARSVYKLEEIDKKFKLISRGHQLLDLGCYPGSWSQYAIKKTGPKGSVVGIDLIRPDRLSAPNFRFIQADALTCDTDWLIREIDAVDMVMSDLAPRTTGIRLADASRSMALAKKASAIAMELLKGNGHFICKIFEGEDLGNFKSEISRNFRQVRLFRPKATRKRSREVFLVGISRMTKRHAKSMNKQSIDS